MELKRAKLIAKPAKQLKPGTPLLFNRYILAISKDGNKVILT